jgi:sucrose phosphorylase
LADSESTQTQKFLASQSIQYALPGVPATYIHSLLGSRNWLAGVQQTGRARTLNREKLEIENVLAELEDPGSFRAGIFFPYLHLIKIRKQQPAFHPSAAFAILDLDAKVFAIKRSSDTQVVYALTNISSREVAVDLKNEHWSKPMVDLITGETIRIDPVVLKPYQFVWLATGS